MKASIHPTVIRTMFEEKYAEMSINKKLPEDIHDYNALKKAILDNSQEIIDLTQDPKLCDKECHSFVVCIQMHQSYAKTILIRHHMKQIYIRLLSSGYAAYNPMHFPRMIANESLNNESIMELLSDIEDEDEKFYKLDQIAREFLNKVYSGKILIPTKPSLDYIPSQIVKRILLKYVGS